MFKKTTIMKRIFYMIIAAAMMAACNNSDDALTAGVGSPVAITFNVSGDFTLNTKQVLTRIKLESR
jgi:hypothetical protein